MKQILTLLLPRNKEIEIWRQQYDPRYSIIEPHITLVYPFDVQEKEQLFNHITRVLNKYKSFTIRLSGIQQSSKGLYLYLLVSVGKKTLLSLHSELNGGLLEDYSNPDMNEYIPHLSIGVFTTEKEKIRAMKEIQNAAIDVCYTISSVQLLTIDDTQLISKEDFGLNST